MADNPPMLGFNALTAPGIPREDEPYFAALGRFIAAYAMAENQVHVLARRLTRLNDAKARIVFSGMRLGDLSERIRGLLRLNASSTRKYDEADVCLRQLDFIATQRNNIVHRFVRYRQGKIEVTNLVIAKSIDAPETHTFAITDFEKMDSDCAAITLRLSAISPGKAHEKMKPTIKMWVHQPWRYKPPQPVQKAKQRPSTPRQQKPPLPASDE